MKNKILPTAFLTTMIALGGISSPAFANIEKDDRPSFNSDSATATKELGPGHLIPGPKTPLLTMPDGSKQFPETHEDEDLISPPGSKLGISRLQSPETGSAATANSRGDIKVTMVTVKLADTNIADTRAMSMAAMEKSVADTSAYWKSMSNNRLSTSISERILEHQSSAKSTQDYPTIMNTIRREIGWVDGPYEALIVYIPINSLSYGGYGGYLGAGWTSSGIGGSILMPKPSSLTSPVMAHEYGHILGNLHANALQCTNGRADVGINSSSMWADGSCTSREYGDTVDLMGGSQAAMPAINSMFWDKGGFGRGDEIRNVGPASGIKSYTLKPWAGTEANRSVKFLDPVSMETYYLELRAPVGYDAGIARNGNRGVKIVKEDIDNPSWAPKSVILMPSTRPFGEYYGQNHAWQAGQTFTTHGGVKVAINSVSDGSATVTVTAAGATPPPVVAPTPPPVVKPTPTPTPPPVVKPVVKPVVTTPSVRSGDIVTFDGFGNLWNYGNMKTSRVKIGTGWSVMKDIHVIDWNVDGVQDIIGQTKTGQMYFYKGKPGGGFTKVLIGNGGWQNFETVVGKWKKTDKYPSVIGKSEITGELFNYPNLSGSALSSRVKVGSGWAPLGIDLVDWDKDGSKDILAKTPQGQLKLYRTNGAGSFISEPRKVVGNGGWQNMSNVKTVHGFDKNASATGLIARDRAGSLYYYQINKGVWGSVTRVGTGWNTYTVAGS